MSLLNLLKSKLPIGRNEWKEEEQIHARHFPNKSRDVNSLRCKFNTLCHKKMGSGNPNIPFKFDLLKKFKYFKQDVLTLAQKMLHSTWRVLLSHLMVCPTTTNLRLQFINTSNLRQLSQQTHLILHHQLPSQLLLQQILNMMLMYCQIQHQWHHQWH